MAKRKLTMNKRPKRHKSTSCLMTLLLLPFELIKELYNSILDGLNSENPEEKGGCGCLIALLVIGGLVCYFLLLNSKISSETEDARLRKELIELINKSQ